MKVKINNYSKRVGLTGERAYYKWRAFVDEPPSVLDSIKQVEYFLHHSFPEPYQKSRDKADKFALETHGWGEFKLGVGVTFEDGTEEYLKYNLVLDPEKKPWPDEPPD